MSKINDVSINNINLNEMRETYRPHKSKKLKIKMKQAKKSFTKPCLNISSTNKDNLILNNITHSKSTKNEKLHKKLTKVKSMSNIRNHPNIKDK
jgi:hypothetical protein